MASVVFDACWYVRISCVNLYFFRIVMIWWLFTLFLWLVMFRQLLCLNADFRSNGHQDKTRAAKCSCWKSWEKNGCTTSSSRITMLYFKDRISWQEGLSTVAKKAGKFLHICFLSVSVYSVCISSPYGGDCGDNISKNLYSS